MQHAFQQDNSSSNRSKPLHTWACLPKQCKLERSPSTDQSVSLAGVALITWHCILVKLTGIMAELDSRSLAHDTCILHDPVRIVCFRGKGWPCSIVFSLGCCSLMYIHWNHGTWPNFLLPLIFYDDASQQAACCLVHSNTCPDLKQVHCSSSCLGLMNPGIMSAQVNAGCNNCSDIGNQQDLPVI